MRRLLIPLLLLSLAAGCAERRFGPPGHGPGPGGPDQPDDGGERAMLFISPMGEPFRAPHAPERLWFDGADTDGDGRLTPAEFQADALRFFALLDQGKDGEIDPDDVTRYETVLAPEIRTGDAGGGPRGGGGRGGRGGPPPRGGGGGGGGGGGPSGSSGPGGSSFQFGGDQRQPKYAEQRQGAMRFGYLDLPEPVVAADRNMNRGIDRTEMLAAAAQRFAILDTDHDGAIARGELPRLAPAPAKGGGGPRPGQGPGPDQRVGTGSGPA